MGELPDAELVHRIGSGGLEATQAEAELCRRFAPRVRLYGLRHLRDDDRAAELVQTVLLAVLEAARAGRIEEADKLDRFVLGTCRNASSRLHGATRRAVPVPPEVTATWAAPAKEHVDRGALVRCIGQLEERARRVVLLSFQEEQATESIAGVLGTNVGHVRVLRHRAIAALRRCLDGRGTQA